MKKKVLNLYAGIGGNRKLWTDCKVTAVEYNPDIAAIYKDFFPQDDVIVGDAHEFLLKNYKEFDFIWTSPPCPTHSRARYWGSFGGKIPAKYPDFRLYEEIYFLKHYAKCKWVVENVVPYYEPLLPAQKIGRHLFWANFTIQKFEAIDADINRGTRKEWQELHGFDISKYRNIGRKDKILRNCVHPKTGLELFNQAMGILSAENTEQLKLAI